MDKPAAHLTQTPIKKPRLPEQPGFLSSDCISSSQKMPTPHLKAGSWQFHKQPLSAPIYNGSAHAYCQYTI
jgi:hypothetical protein